MDTRAIQTTRRTIGRGGRTPNVIGVHTMEAPEGLQTAENIAYYFRTVNASAHWNVDGDSRVRVVNDGDTAWTMPPINSRSLNIEIAGYARQSAAEWNDTFSNAALFNAAVCAAEWVRKYNIPIRRLTEAQLRAGESGFCGHVDASRAFGKSTHWDPGPNFPWEKFLNLVRGLVGQTQTVGTVLQAYDSVYIRGRQNLLNVVGYHLTPNGVSDNNFVNAVRHFQAKSGLPVDGDCGQLTTAKLFAVIADRQKPGYNFAAMQSVVRAVSDGIWGPDTDKRFTAVAEATKNLWPWGVQYAQSVIGALADGQFGDDSRNELKNTIQSMQFVLNCFDLNAGAIDGDWGDQTNRAFNVMRNAALN